MNQRKGIIMFILLTFTATALFGFAISFVQDDMGQMTHCPFMSGHSSICPMSAFQHVDAWQMMFVAVLPLIAAAFVLRVFAQHQIIASVASEQAPPERTQIAAFIPLLTQVFSSGILHPKLYA